MADKPKDYESTVMRIAGNSASTAQQNLIERAQHWKDVNPFDPRQIAVEAAKIARAIVAEVQRTKPK